MIDKNNECKTPPPSEESLFEKIEESKQDLPSLAIASESSRPATPPVNKTLSTENFETEIGKMAHAIVHTNNNFATPSKFYVECNGTNTLVGPSSPTSENKTPSPTQHPSENQQYKFVEQLAKKTVKQPTKPCCNIL